MDPGSSAPGALYHSILMASKVKWYPDIDLLACNEFKFGKEKNRSTLNFLSSEYRSSVRKGKHWWKNDHQQKPKFYVERRTTYCFVLPFIDYQSVGFSCFFIRSCHADASGSSVLKRFLFLSFVTSCIPRRVINIGTLFLISLICAVHVAGHLRDSLILIQGSLLLVEVVLVILFKVAFWQNGIGL